MDIGYAISFIFEDRKWVSKIVLLTVFCFLSPLAVLVVGLPIPILLLGYMLTLAGNVRAGLPRPLPEWDKWGEKFFLGGQVFMAMMLYNLPLLFIGGCSWLLIGGLGSGVIGGGISFFTACCALPFGLLYMIFAWPMLAVGVSEFLETREAGALYRFVHLWDVMRANSKVLRQWALYAALVNIVLLILLIIPCIGWLLIGMFGTPLHGHLFGQFAHQLSLTNKPQPHKKSPRRA